MQENIDLLNLIFTPGRIAIMIAGTIPMFFGLFRMFTADGDPQQYQNGHSTTLFGALLAAVVVSCVISYTYFTNYGN